MDFKKICIDGKNYGVDDHKNNFNAIVENNINFYDDDMDELKNLKTDTIKKTLLHLACCHSLLVKNQDEISEFKYKDDYKNITYTASSPDELALASMAKSFDYLFR